MDGDVQLDRVLVAPQEVGHGPGLRFRLGERSTVDLGAGVTRGSLRWKEKEGRVGKVGMPLGSQCNVLGCTADDVIKIVNMSFLVKRRKFLKCVPISCSFPHFTPVLPHHLAATFSLSVHF